MKEDKNNWEDVEKEIYCQANGVTVDRVQIVNLIHIS
jgi:hypothetical protein